MWALVPLNFVVAYVIATYGSTWNVPDLFVVLVGSTAVSAVSIDQWAIADNKPQAAGQVLSSMTRYGQPTIVGLLISASMAIVYTAVIMLVFFTPVKIDPPGILFWTLFAMGAYLPFGLLLPAYMTHGSVHTRAVEQTIAGWLLLAIFYYVRVDYLQ